MLTEPTALLLIGVALCLGLGCWIARSGALLRWRLANQALEHAQAELDALKETQAELSERLQQSEQAVAEWRQRAGIAQAETQHWRQRLVEQQRWQDQLRGELGQQFRNLAQEVLEQRGALSSQQQEHRLKDLLEPLRGSLAEFTEQVQQANLDQAQRSGALGRQLQELKQLHAGLSREAVELSRALKGDRRTQGVWGELVLEKVLEASGLRAGHEYQTQVVLRREDGSRPRPDVLVRLPAGQTVVIDSKCSLSAYERAQQTVDAVERERELQAHLAAIRIHIDELAQRDYASLVAAGSPGLVLMFLPIEAAFLEALRCDPQLLEYALSREIALVTPSTLMLSLRSINLLWQGEKRDRNAAEIAECAGRLYDKFAGFVSDLGQLEQSLARASRELESAQTKLRSGPGNLLRQVERLKELGARTSKNLPTAD